jgi:hypothetical protein
VYGFFSFFCFLAGGCPDVDADAPAAADVDASPLTFPPAQQPSKVGSPPHFLLEENIC